MATVKECENVSDVMIIICVLKPLAVSICFALSTNLYQIPN